MAKTAGQRKAGRASSAIGMAFLQGIARARRGSPVPPAWVEKSNASSVSDALTGLQRREDSRILVDSGCNGFMVKDSALFKDLDEAFNTDVDNANGSRTRVKSRCTAHLTPGHKTGPFFLRFVPVMTYTLFVFFILYVTLD